MPRTLIVQTIGSILIPLSFVSSEFAVRMLDKFPSSAVAWCINLTVFGPLEQARAVPSLLASFLERTAPIELLLLLIVTIIVQVVRFRLGVAFMSHLSFGTSIIVARAWITDLNGSITLGLLWVREGSGTSLVVLLLTASACSCIVCHLSFLLDIMQPSSDRARTRTLTAEASRQYRRTFLDRAWNDFALRSRSSGSTLTL